MALHSDILGDTSTLATVVIGGIIVAIALAKIARGPSHAHAFEAVVHARYACKEFNAGREVPEALLTKLIELTQRSPTSFNTQPWSAVIVRSPEAKAKLVASLAPGNQPKAESAPVNIVFISDTEPEKLLSPSTPDFVRNALPVFLGQASTPEAWAWKQTMTAAQTFMLAATAHGLATNPMEGFKSMQAVRDAVGLPPRYSVPVVISLGYEKAPRPKVSTRNDPEAMWHYDTFTQRGKA